MEEMITNMVKALDISRDEAIALIESDKEIDRMTMKQANEDLTEEQKAVSKKARQSDRKKNTTTTKRERKPNDAKRHLMECFQELLKNMGAEVNITNAEREMEFHYNGIKYKMVLSQPRS